MEAWLRGSGCVPLNNLMEDAATAEISRAQIWQWIRHPRGRLDDGRRVTLGLFEAVLAAELDGLRRSLGDERYAAGRFDLAARLFAQIVAGDPLEEFLTLRAYEHLD
jgi:malate synthase